MNTNDKAGPTPGPWALLADEGYRVNGREVHNRVVAGNREIARVAGVAADKHGEHNARLIAAAPDLLAACEAALGLLVGYDDKLNPKHSAPVFSTLRAAIAKARGAS